ncbi:hypothetical protein [Clostridium beijerinckii]|uniref:hypothetical protein n=1 Tax=Clostridium beijerinckii TaxID=1520 RepID=UPI001570C6CD|nr:hypothetical protein [Clostridium beijerinckii]NRT75133.1 hypothetical protein [Clostridium beijerinckii]
MPIKVVIQDNNLTYFSAEAKDELKNQMEKYASEIIKETGRLEETIRDDNSTPEITRELIRKAITKYKDSFNRSKKVKKFPIIKFISTISLFLAGLLFDFDSFKTDTILLAMFIIIFTVATISTTIMFVKEGDTK